MSREQRRDALLLALLALALFGWLAPSAGLHHDDYGFWTDFEGSGPAKLARLTLEYVPGRNLFLPLFYALHSLCSGRPALMHAAGAALDALNAVLLMLLARGLGAAPGVALCAAGLFLAWPNHGETHWWASSVMMNLFSTTLVLGAALAAGAGRLPLAAGLFFVALFDYDQVYLLWIPLLAYARLRDPRLSGRRLAGWAAFFISLNAVHLAARLFSPWAGGGRPMPQLATMFESATRAVAVTLAPLRRNPSLPDWPGGLALAALPALALGVLWVRRCARGWSRGPRAEAALAVFGGVWWLLAYAPNFLWYISPRHNYLPSAGTALAAAALASRLSALPRARAPLAALGAGLFALFALSAWSDGAAWAASAARHARFAADAGRALGGATPAVFLVGEARDLRTAPGFTHPNEPAWALAHAGVPASGRSDLSIAPTRGGIFSGGQRALFGEDAPPSFVRLDDAALFYPDGGGFSCARTLRVSGPGLAPRALTLPAGACAGTRDFDAPAALVESRSLGRGAPAPDGPALESAALSPAPGGADLVLTWRAGAAPRDFAFHLRLLDGAGRVVWVSTRRPSDAEHEHFWPLYDDARPASDWRPGERVRQRFRLAYAGGAASARLTVFGRRDGAAWEKLGTREIRF